MSRPIAYQGVLCTGHDDYPPRNNITASTDVFVGGFGVVRVGDYWPEHYEVDGDGFHDGHLAEGSSTVYVNNQPVGRIGDMLDCGSAVAQGSDTVFVG